MFTWVEIDIHALRFNLRQFRRLIGKKTLLMPVVKSNAYGHGLVPIAQFCNKEKEVDRICVVNDDEALELIKNKITKPIMILTFFNFDVNKIVKLAKKQVIFPLYTLKQADFLNKIGESTSKKIKVHIKIDTGAARIGIMPEEAIKFFKKIKIYRHLKIEGLWSHFASSEDDRGYTKKQYNIFQQVVEKFNKLNISFPVKHMSCSAAAVLFNFKKFNAVRLGLGFYGLHSSKYSLGKLVIKPALSWHTKIIQLKKVSANSKISYGGTYVTTRPTRLAVIPVGYWDGYDRQFSNRASVLIKGQRCRVLGRVCMNLTMVDVTNVKKLRVGEKVTLLGKNGHKRISAEELAKLAGTINYEIISRINPLIMRIYRK